jgi:putative ABC transport system permease protein
MLTLFRTLGLRALSKRWGRSLLVTLSIALGVATLVSSQLLNGTITAAVTDSLQPLKGVAELTVANGDAGVRRDLAARLRKVSGVKAALPLVVERVTLPDADNRSVVLLGVEVPTDAPPADDNPFGVRVKLDLAMAALARVFGRRPAVAGSELAALLPGGPLKVRAGNKVHNLDVVGTVSAEGPAASLGKLLLVVDAGDAAEMFGRPGYVQRIDVFLEPGTDRQAAREALQAAVGDSARVETPDEQGRASSEVMTGVKVGFGLCGAGALVVGMFLVYNALSVTVAERRREIGILRSVGATRRQIAVLFASEAAVLGVIGAALGVPLGWALARGLLPLIQWVMRELNVGGEIGLDMTPGLAVVAVAAGVAVALLAALVPSLQAAGPAPPDAVRRAPGGGAWLFQVAQPAVAVLLVLAGGGMVLARGWLPRHTGHYGGMVLALVGMLLATPVLASLLARLLRPLVRAVFGIEARLAADNLLRSPGRTGLVIGALAAGVAMVLQVAGVAQAIERPVLAWVDRSILADLFVKCGTAGAYFPMDEDAAGRLRATEGVRHVFGVRSRLLPYHYTSVLVVALDADV